MASRAERLAAFNEPISEVADGLTALVGVLDERLGAVSGLIGPKGDTGDPGRDGIDGKDGRDGVDGKQGLPGRDGEDGAPGQDGRPGTDGKPGKAGTSGSAGTPGPVGPPGPSPIRVVVEREGQQITFAQVYRDDGSTQRMAVERDAVGRFIELVRVA